MAISLEQNKLFLKEKEGERIFPTLNKYGYTHAKPLKYGRKFIEFCKHVTHPVLDIGATYGVNTIPALLAGATVIANDIEKKHLDILKINTPQALWNNLEFLVGSIPHGVELEVGSVEAILASGVLHFLNAEDFLIALAKIHRWLIPGGRFFFETSSVYNRLFSGFLKEYQKRKSDHVDFPGFVEDTEKYLGALSEYVPKQLTLFGKEELLKVFEQVGFDILEVGYFSLSDGRGGIEGKENIGLIVSPKK
jgi:SAM-dependent methyltransferase